MILKVDSRGRVRFSHDGWRIVVTESSVAMYDREPSWVDGRRKETPRHSLPVRWLENEEFLSKLGHAKQALVAA